MVFPQPALINLAVICALMSALWLVSLIKRDASIIDPVWGLGFTILAWVTLATSPVQAAHSWLLAMLVTIWGLRLSGYLFWRNYGKAEDRRYRAMREKHGDKFWWISFLTVFMLQAVLLWLVAFPVQAAMQAKTAMWPLVVLGSALWLVGFSFETIGDYQMARFQADPENAGKVLNAGLWRYTRHPNYFGDFCVWWGIYLFAIASGAFWTIVSPIVMSLLLMRVSGVTLLESDIKERRPEYREYQRRTNAFFPGPVKD